jgi:hypothetical protein
LRIRGLRGLPLAGLLLGLAAPSTAGAQTEWQVRPFGSLTFGGGTTLNDPDHASGKLKVAIGVGAGLLGEVFGFDVDLGRSPGFFEAGGQELVSRSSVTTFTGNIVIGPPRSATEFTLRPYFVGGFGVMRAHSFDGLGALDVNMTSPAINLGGGVFGALSDRTGLSWELRYFRSVGETELRGQSTGPERLSFWRANMAFVVRLRG